MFILRASLIVLMVVVGQQITQAQSVVKIEDRDSLNRVVAYVVQQEITAGDLMARSDLCIGIGYGLMIKEKDIVFELKKIGMKLHSSSWCNRNMRGLIIVVVAPIRETSPAIYELDLELGDLSPVKKGEDFGTLLKQGTYVIRCDKGSEPKIVSYRRTCCDKTN